MPSLSNTPWIRGAPHSGLAMLISRIPVTEDRPNAPSFPCPASESETTWTHVKRLAGSHPSITFDSTQLSDAVAKSDLHAPVKMKGPAAMPGLLLSSKSFSVRHILCRPILGRLHHHYVRI